VYRKKHNRKLENTEHVELELSEKNLTKLKSRRQKAT